MSKIWKRSVLLLLFILSDESGTLKPWTTAASAYGKFDENLQSRLVSEEKMSFYGTKLSLRNTSLSNVTKVSSSMQFCVASPNSDPNALRNGLDWACGPGSANCSAIQPGQPCYEDSLMALASYAYNDYYQKTKANGGTCNFGNTAMLINTDPSHGSCIFTGSPGASRNTSTGGGSPSQPPSGPSYTDGAMPLQCFRATYLFPVILHFLLHIRLGHDSCY